MERDRNRLSIRPELLLADNRSGEASQRLADWELAKAQGMLTLIEACGDARLDLDYFIDPNIATVTTIAAAGGPSDYRYLLNHPGTGSAIKIGHFGCGGIHVKSQRTEGFNPVERLAHIFVDKRIKSPHVISQTFLSARETARLTDKPVLAAVMNHNIGLIYPIAEITNHGRSINAVVDTKVLENPNAGFNEDNVPALDIGQLSPIFQNTMYKNRDRVGEWVRNGDRIRSQVVQDPVMAVMSTSPIPTSIFFPSLYYPNRVFNVRVPFKKGVGEGTRIEDYAVGEAIQQIDYPLGQAVKPTPDFASTKTLLIKTPHINLSRQLARRVLEERFSHDWIRYGGNILVAEIHSGMATKIENFSV